MRTRLILYSWLSSGLMLAQSTGTYTAAGEMTTPRMYHSAMLLANGKVLIAARVRANPPRRNRRGPLRRRSSHGGRTKFCHHLCSFLFLRSQL